MEVESSANMAGSVLALQDPAAVLDNVPVSQESTVSVVSIHTLSTPH